MYYIYGRVRAIPTYRVYRLYDSLGQPPYYKDTYIVIVVLLNAAI